ncbi:MAG: glycoside hydrolase [Verrucomicrobia bacterium]|nr:glycoside hydrolase [Verrucomicrobiota bacterium]
MRRTSPHQSHPSHPLTLALLLLATTATAADFLLPATALRADIARFNALDTETVTNHIPNAAAADFLAANAPRFDCPDRELVEIWNFRWWTFRKHLKHTPDGFVVTEFLTPVKHAGAHNTISCATGFHLAEGRWLRDSRFLDDYTRFWLRGGSGAGVPPATPGVSPGAATYRPQPHFHKFSSWFAAAVWDRACVTGDFAFATNLLDDLVADYRVWETERRLPSGLFWQYDVKDGMEESISGSRTAQQPRPTINSYMTANARALAALAQLAQRPELAKDFSAKADELHRLTLDQLWDNEAQFFKVRRAVAAGVPPAVEPGVPPGGKGAKDQVRNSNSSALQNSQPSPGGRMPPSTSGGTPAATFSSAREAIGFVPWMFHLPDARHSAAWLQLTGPAGFHAPFGLTTAERRHPQFRTHGTGKCEWDGPVWPFATSQTLTALANFLRVPRAGDLQSPSASPSTSRSGDFKSPALPNRSDYLSALLTYTRSHRFHGQPYIGEYLDETTGAWLKGNAERSRHYNHSTFADLIITGLVGLIPRADDTIEVNPLLPDGTWDWFCLDAVPYHGRTLTILWDKTGEHYRKGAGLRLFADGKLLTETNRFTRVTGKLN